MATLRFDGSDDRITYTPEATLRDLHRRDHSAVVMFNRNGNAASARQTLFNLQQPGGTAGWKPAFQIDSQTAVIGRPCHHQQAGGGLHHQRLERLVAVRLQPQP